ncbi:hypothetical protein EDB19DRAFT_1838321 [Suillus lakei]|nr:hypothetical protein EDB19DRAFT_1838321 [Suillus lakei]
MSNKGSKLIASCGLALPHISLHRRRLSCGSVGFSLPFGLRILSSGFRKEALGSSREREQLHGLRSCLALLIVAERPAGTQPDVGVGSGGVQPQSSVPEVELSFGVVVHVARGRHIARGRQDRVGVSLFL